MPGNGSRAKSKLKELLSGLDLDVSGGLGLDEDELALSEKDGLSERTTDFGGSDFSDTISESTDRDYRPMGRQPHSRSHVTANKYMLMEQRMMQVMRESKNMQQKYEKQLKERDLEISELQAHLNSAVKELDTRQKEIETRAPIFKLKLDEFREKLKDLRISDAQYEDLRRMPPEGLHIVDEVKVAVYASTADLKKENENLRLTLTSLRETSARAEEDAGQCRSDAARATAALVDKEKDMQTATSALKARVDRLASDLEQAMVRAELNSAKGTLYDELRAKTEKLEQDNQRLQVVEATYKRLELEHRERETMWSRKEHTLEMLMMDKAYLSKQVDFLTDQLRKLDSDLEGKEQKVNELTKARQDLLERLMTSETLKGKHEEARLQKDISALQASTHADLERIRVETAEAYEREARLLRELRDQASDEASRAKVSLSELQNLHEKSGLNWSEQHRKMDSRLSELNSEIRQKAFELGHLKVVLGEKDSLLHRANINAEMHQEKMNVLMDRYRALEAEHLVLATGVSRGPQDPPPPALPGVLPASSSMAGMGQMQQEDLLLRLQVEKEALSAQASMLQTQLRAAQEALKLAGQPHSFLLEELVAAKAQAGGAETRYAVAAAALRTKEAEVAELIAERDALKRDLDVILSHRSQLDSVKHAVMRAMGGSPAAAPTQEGGGRPAAQEVPGLRRPASPHYSTTIIGEGPSET